MSLLLQAFLVALAVTIAFIGAHTTQTHIFRPTSIGPPAGAVMGSFNTGSQAGVAIGLMLLAVILVETAVPSGPTISIAIVATVATLGGGRIDLAIATTFPVSFMGRIAEIVQDPIIDVWFIHRAEHAIEELGTRGLVMNSTVFIMATNAFLCGVPTFLAVHLDADFVADIIKAVPDRAITGLSVGGDAIGAIGFALLLSSIKSHTMWLFLFLGFLFAAYLQISMVDIVLLAVVFAVLHYYFKLADEGKE